MRTQKSLLRTLKLVPFVTVPYYPLLSPYYPKYSPADRSFLFHLVSQRVLSFVSIGRQRLSQCNLTEAKEATTVKERAYGL